MSEQRHTPGPWTYLSDFGEIWTEYGLGEDAKCIVRVPPPCNEEDEDWRWIEGETDANGLLIAAAPDHALLLAALVSGRAKMGLPLAGEVCVLIAGPAADQACWATLDPFGCPTLTPDLRAALAPAAGAQT